MKLPFLPSTRFGLTNAKTTSWVAKIDLSTKDTGQHVFDFSRTSCYVEPKPSH